MRNHQACPQEEAAMAYIAGAEKHAVKEVCDREFFHVGFVNYKTWEMSVVRLQPKPDEATVRTLWLEEIGKIDAGLRSQPSASLLEADVPRLQALSLHVCTLLGALLKFIDFQHSYSMSLWRMKCDGDLLSDDDMRPGIFEVQQLTSVETVPNIWKGGPTEDFLRTPVTRKRKRGGRVAVDFNEPGPADVQRQAPDAVHDAEGPDDDNMDVNMDAAGVGFDLSEEEDAFDQQSSEDSEGGDAEEIESSAGRSDASLALGLLDDLSDADADVSEPAQAPQADEPEEDALPAAGGLLGELGLEFVDNPAAAEIHFQLSEGMGQIRFNLVGSYFKAVCPIHRNCQRQRTAKGSAGISAVAEGQGRPLGALVAWLQQAQSQATRTEHMAMPAEALARRQAAREWFLEHHGAINFSQDHERALRAGENPEPSMIR